jgi:uncharacterized protein YbjT (DUF2867 family)
MTITTAILVGSSGLIGKELQTKIGNKYGKLLAISRKPMGALPINTDNLVVDFESDWQKISLPTCDAFFCALGTTIKTAGSQEAFRKVDFDHVVNSAKAAKRAGATKMAVVSALGASSKSSVFYNRTKGEMEEALKSLGFSKLLIVRPSFLSGNREVLGQAKRPGEAIALAVSSVLNPFIPKKYRSISANAVASCMVEQLDSMTTSLEVIESDQIQKWQTG